MHNDVNRNKLITRAMYSIRRSVKVSFHSQSKCLYKYSRIFSAEIILLQIKASGGSVCSDDINTVKH